MQQMNSFKSKRQGGFTLIELVVVIVILGILAATALPRFFDMSTDAKKAAVAGVGGAFTTGVAGEHAKWLVNGASMGTCVTTATPGTFTGCSTGDTALIDGVTVAFNAFGYPANLTSATLGATTGLLTVTDAICTSLWNVVLSANSPSVVVTTTTATAANTAGGADWVASQNAATTPTGCVYTYFGGAKVAPAVIRSITYTPSTGLVVLANS